jgi:hypothetical protein
MKRNLATEFNGTMVMRLSRFAVLFAIISCPTVGQAADWTYRAADEDWGLTCFAETKIRGVGRLGFMGAKGGDIVAYISSDTIHLPVSGSAEFSVDRSKPIHLEGGISDYSGDFEFGSSRELMQQIAHGKALKISAPWLNVANLGLTGARAAFDRFAACMK